MARPTAILPASLWMDLESTVTNPHSQSHVVSKTISMDFNSRYNFLLALRPSVSLVTSWISSDHLTSAFCLCAMSWIFCNNGTSSWFRLPSLSLFLSNRYFDTNPYLGGGWSVGTLKDGAIKLSYGNYNDLNSEFSRERDPRIGSHHLTNLCSTLSVEPTRWVSLCWKLRYLVLSFPGEVEFNVDWMRENFQYSPIECESRFLKSRFSCGLEDCRFLPQSWLFTKGQAQGSRGETQRG